MFRRFQSNNGLSPNTRHNDNVSDSRGLFLSVHEVERHLEVDPEVFTAPGLLAQMLIFQKANHSRNKHVAREFSGGANMPVSSLWGEGCQKLYSTKHITKSKILLGSTTMQHFCCMPATYPIYYRHSYTNTPVIFFSKISPTHCHPMRHR